MTYNEALNALDNIGRLVNNYEFDQPQRTYYGIAIDTIRKLLTMQKEPCVNCPMIPVRPVSKDNKIYCGACGRRIPKKINAQYCHKCGRSINWL